MPSFQESPHESGRESRHPWADLDPSASDAGLINGRLDLRPEGPRHRLKNSAESGQERDGLPGTRELIERFRMPNLDPDALRHNLKLVTEFAATNELSPDDGREVVGAAYEYFKREMAAGDDTLAKPLAELKFAVYGTPVVEPVTHRLEVGPERHRTHGQTEAALEWHGSPIKIDPFPKEVAPAHPEATVSLTLGPDDTWYIQRPGVEPYALQPDHVVTLGGSQLGGNPGIAENHYNLRTNKPSEGAQPQVEITGHAAIGTHITTSEFPDPEKVRARPASGDGPSVQEIRDRIQGL